MKLELRTTYQSAFRVALDFLLDNGAVAATERLSEALLYRLPERLMQHPHIGQDFLARSPQTPEALAAWEMARALVGDDIELRELIEGDYLVLYAIHRQTLHLLTLRHHRQAAYDFSGA